MAKQLYYLAFLSICLLSLLSCGKEETPIDNSRGSIYGAVTDFSTGAPIANANVSLQPGGETTLTGYDGIYEFLNVPDGEYSILVSKAEYTDLEDDGIIRVSSGRRIRRDVQLRKQVADLMITDVYGNSIKSLNFGSDIYTINKPFNIFNNGTVNIACKIIYSCDWIKSVSRIPDKISPGQNVTVNVEINRSKLALGSNETLLHITSNNGSNILKITASRTDSNTPSVVTLPVTYIDGSITPWCNTFHANVTNEGFPAYHTRGFCFSSSNPEPTISDNRINVAGSGTGEYSYTYKDFPNRTERYYVRAWVMYGADNKIQYGNIQTFVYNDVIK